MVENNANNYFYEQAQPDEEVIDLRETPSTEQVNTSAENGFRHEDHFQGSVNRILLLGVAGRDIFPSTLILRRDRQIPDGRWLQNESIEIVQNAAMAGLDRINGNFLTESIDHSVYDQLFDRFADNTHGEFVERLAWMGRMKWHLINDAQFEMRPEERQMLKDSELRMTKASNKLFRDLFFPIATAETVPEKYRNWLNEIIDPAVGIEFLSSLYWQDALQYTSKNNRAGIKEFRYYSWIREQGTKLRTRHSHKLAFQQAVSIE